MNKLNKNIFFIGALFVIIICIILLNYFMDPYNYFSDKYNSEIVAEEDNYDDIYLKLKINKNTYDTLVIGGSNVNSLFPDNKINKRYFQMLTLLGSNYSEILKLLKAYIDTHTDTKRVIVILGILPILNNYNLALPPYTGKNLNKNELKKLFLSLGTTKKSLIKLYYKFLTPSQESFSISQQNNCNIYPYRSVNTLMTSESDFDENYKKDITEMVNFLKEKNLKFDIIISPTNALVLSLIYKNPSYRKQFENFKRALVNQNIEVYDMSYVNLYTKENLNNKSELFMDGFHPTRIMGIKIIKLLFDKKNDRKDFYIILNKNNIKENLEKENKLLQDYIDNNKELIQHYEDIINQKIDVDFNYCLIKDKNAPIKKEFLENIDYKNEILKQHNLEL